MAVLLAGCARAEQPRPQEGTVPPPAEPRSPPVAPDPQRRPASTGLLSADDERSFARLQAALGGEIGLAVGPLGVGGPRYAWGGLTTGSAWSTIKIPISARVLEDGTVPPGDPRIRRALTESDNAAAASLWGELSTTHGGVRGAAEAVGAILRSAGDWGTKVSVQGRGGFSPYGQTRWSLAAQQQFISSFAAGCSAAPDVVRPILKLMGDVVPGQRWGLGSAGVPTRFKGGWGPGIDGRYLVRQVGILDLGGGNRPVGVAVAARARGGSFQAATRELTAIARWTADHIDVRRAPKPRC